MTYQTFNVCSQHGLAELNGMVSMVRGEMTRLLCQTDIKHVLDMWTCLKLVISNSDPEFLISHQFIR